MWTYLYSCGPFVFSNRFWNVTPSMLVQLKFITQWTSASSPSRWKFKKNYGILKPWTNIWVHTKEIFDILLPLLPWQPTNLRRSHAAAAGLRGQSAPPGWVLRSFWIIFIVVYQNITCNKSLHRPCCVVAFSYCARTGATRSNRGYHNGPAALAGL